MDNNFNNNQQNNSQNITYEQQMYNNQQMIQQQQLQMNMNQYPNNIYQSYQQNPYNQNLYGNPNVYGYNMPNFYGQRKSGMLFNMFDLKMLFPVILLFLTYILDFVKFDGSEMYKFNDFVDFLSKEYGDLDDDWKIYVWFFVHQNMVLIPLIIVSVLCIFLSFEKLTDVAIILSILNLIVTFIYTLGVLMGKLTSDFSPGLSYYLMILGCVFVIGFLKPRYRKK